MKLINPKAFIQKGVITLVTVCLLVAVPVLGQSGGDYELSRSRIAAGGVSSGGDFVLSGVVGQAEAGYMSGGDYELTGGFLPGLPVCIVDFYHFTRFAEYWLQTDCNDLNEWCDGADLNYTSDVNSADLDLFVDEWLCCCPRGWPLR